MEMEFFRNYLNAKMKIVNLKNTQLKEIKKTLEYKKDNTSYYFPMIREYKNPFIYESKDISRVYGRLSLMGFDPCLKISGKDQIFSIQVLNSRGRLFFDHINQSDFEDLASFAKTETQIQAEINIKKYTFNEDQRVSQNTTLSALRVILDKFKTKNKVFLGLYGAFSYDIVRLYEDIGNHAQDEGVDDFCFFIYDSFLHFDHLKEKAEMILYREKEEDIDFKNQIETGDFEISNQSFDQSKEEYMQNVLSAKDLALKGELFEVVFARKMEADFKGDSFALYERYRDINPSPYMFYFDFGDDEYLVGASPEMMIRVERGKVHVRPISGTAKRENDLIKDHENMLKLLNSEKERSELDMLIDLARNDLARISEKGVEITEYRTVEKYSRVMHTVAHVQAKLKNGLVALDAYISSANAGTLTGAPKVAAMRQIELHEKTRRGFYGGGIGYLAFNGDMDTGIIIRTAHIKQGKLSYRAGATLLYDSDPKAEIEETENKSRAFLDTFC